MKPFIPKKDQLKCAVYALIFERMEEGDIKLDLKFVAEAVEYLSGVESAYSSVHPDGAVAAGKELLAYIDSLSE